MTARFEAYFTDYAAAYDAMDPERIAAFFHCPCMMLNGEFVSVLSTEHAIVTNMRGLVAYHEAEGYGHAAVSDIGVERVAENLALATVRWKIHRRDDSLLWGFRNSYNLADYGDGWKIVVSMTRGDDA